MSNLATELTGVGIVLVVTGLIAGVICITGLSQGVKLLLCVALVLRFVGAAGRQAIAADANVYFKWGREYATYFSRLDFSPFYDPDLWRHESWIGTQFIGYPTGLIMTVVGPSWWGTFFAFGILSFFALLAYAVAYRRSYPGTPFATYWAWLFLMPSLWFWPSSIGKEALMMLGLGIATLGFSGRNQRINWLVMIAGLSLVFCIRPQVTAVFLFAVTITYWLDFDSWNFWKAAQAIVMLIVGMAGILFAMSRALEGEVTVEAVEEYMDRNTALSDQGGSAVGRVGLSPGNVPIAIVNVLMRPFLWEAHNPAALISALEVILIWTLVFVRRRELAAALKFWRRDWMLRFAIPFALLYTISFGLMVSNLGIVARQRVLVFPVLFMIVESGAYYRRQNMLGQHAAGPVVYVVRSYPPTPVPVSAGR